MSMQRTHFYCPCFCMTKGHWRFSEDARNWYSETLDTAEALPQLLAIIGNMNWIPIEVACLNYWQHELDPHWSGGGGGNFWQILHHRRTDPKLPPAVTEQSALPPVGVLQSSCSVSPLLHIDLLAPCNTPVDVGGSPTTRQPEAALTLAEVCFLYWKLGGKQIN